MIYDCFLFNDEVELLELRIAETEDVVDKWVLVECPMNWQQKPKPLYFKDNRKRFAPYLDRIHHAVLHEHPVGPYPVIEHYQRRYLQNAWRYAGAKPGDVILVSDADEIPNPKALASIKLCPDPDPVVLSQFLFYYSVDCLQMQSWNGPIAFQLGEGDVDVQALRDRRNRLPVVSPGGWHFSWLGPLDKLQYKLGCHTVKEDSGGALTPPDASDEAFLSECLTYGKDLFGRTDDYATKRFVSLAPGSLHPSTIMAWLAVHPEFSRRHTGSGEAEAIRDHLGV